MDGACSTHVSNKKCLQTFWQESLKGKGHSEEIGVNWRIILDWISGK